MSKYLYFFCLVAVVASCRSTEDVLRSYIKDSWSRTVRENHVGDSTLIGLPYPYTVPSPEGMFQEIYYWDTYFTNEGLLEDGMVYLAKNNTDNILYLVDKYGFMPNGNRTWYLNRSQPPFLSLMVFSVYKYIQDIDWLHKAYSILEKEYKFWMRDRITYCGLNRYSGESAPQWLIDEFVITGGIRIGRDFTKEPMTQEEHDRIGRNFTAEAESGWDFNPRFDRRCEDFCPVDLNSLMYAFEKNMSYFAKELDLVETESVKWEKKAEIRKQRMMSLMYDREKMQFFDYDYVNDKRSDVVSAAVFYTLFSEVADESIAGEVVKGALNSLEYRYGISVCEDKQYQYEYQWSYPNIWPPTTFIAVFGLDKYGYGEDAERIAKKYAELVEKSWKETGRIWEKYDVNLGVVSSSKEYETPVMLGWSAATYVCLTNYLNNRK